MSATNEAPEIKTTNATHHPTYSRYLEAISSGKAPRARELAKQLNISEGELVACRQGEETWAMKPPFQQLLAQLKTVGEVMTITRNDEAVHETTGTYDKFSFMEKSNMGLVLSEDIDLRLFIGQWHSAFHVVENARHSIQFFNAHGIAVHKVYRTDNTLAEKWDALITEFCDPSPLVPTYLVPEEEPASKLPVDFDQASFALEWSELKDVHEYHGMLKRHGLSRTQALSQIGEQWATKLDQDSVKSAITLAQEENCSIMVFVGNKGCIQIFSGEVHRLMQQGPWFNVLDPGFNLHLREDLITESWAIKRPSNDGIITSIEAFNAKGESILTLFGKRKPGNPELPLWQKIVAEVINLSTKQETRS
ncbi:hemin-degrading factor [Marinomonas rhizomae]|uniref:Putative hemin transport protein n=1 Tax=Marinomonas rhizomae TaxID=491948 RepID=A0A366J863_9GAMM|nr:ChuX/HutX family heme-like substrate-binding protein [Marinomonas rhizomae]RBP83231.1 putative hemin transport protein [Marinomonas rhizomae]RNF72473.1 hemin-degrading factor [Marinomonas rhizomae]